LLLAGPSGLGSGLAVCCCQWRNCNSTRRRARFGLIMQAATTTLHLLPLMLLLCCCSAAASAPEGREHLCLLCPSLFVNSAPLRGSALLLVLQKEVGAGWTCQVVQIIDWHVHLGVPGMPLLPAFTAARYVPSKLPINVLNRQADAACAHWMRYHRCDCPRSWEGPNDGFGNVSWQVPDLHDLQHKHDGPPSSALFSPQCAENVTQWLDNALHPTRLATWCAARVITAPAVTG
jgi:hypothetical protein